MRRLGWVAAGGAVGSLGRVGLDRVVPAAGPVPWTTVLVNLVGAFALGLLLAAPLGAGGVAGERVRLLVGTGALGAFTTYGALAVEAAEGLEGGRPGWALGYVLASLVAGVLAAVLGARAGRRWSARRAAPPQPGAGP